MNQAWGSCLGMILSREKMGELFAISLLNSSRPKYIQIDQDWLCSLAGKLQTTSTIYTFFNSLGLSSIQKMYIKEIPNSSPIFTCDKIIPKN